MRINLPRCALRSMNRSFNEPALCLCIPVRPGCQAVGLFAIYSKQSRGICASIDLVTQMCMQPVNSSKQLTDILSQGVK